LQLKLRASSSNYVPIFKFQSNEETKPIWKEILKAKSEEFAKVAMLVLNNLGEQIRRGNNF
jgi:hypothetical protein